jgi:hypothetical protein
MRPLPGILCLSLILAACSGRKDAASEEAIANQAESLERAANATTDQLIEQIEAESAANAQAAANADAPATNEAAAK